MGSAPQLTYLALLVFDVIRTNLRLSAPDEEKSQEK